MSRYQSDKAPRRRKLSEFEALIEQGWTLIAPDGMVFRKPPKRRYPKPEPCPNDGISI